MPPRKHSRHTFTAGIINADDPLERRILTDRERFTFKDRADNIQRFINEGDTLFGLAQEFYGSMPRASGLWWIVADYQPDPIHDPTIQLEPGRLIVAPSLQVVTQEVFGDARRDET